MAGTTARGGLLKPTDSESADVAVLNANFDKLSDYAVGDFLCTSTTRPAAPWQGMRILEQDTGACLVRVGSNWKPTNRVVCTASTRPANPVVGQEIFETDTGLQYIWNGNRWFFIGLVDVVSPLVAVSGIIDIPSSKRTNNTIITTVNFVLPFDGNIIFDAVLNVGFSTADSATAVNPSKTAGSGVLSVPTTSTVYVAASQRTEFVRRWLLTGCPAGETQSIRFTHTCATGDAGGSYSVGSVYWKYAAKWTA